MPGNHLHVIFDCQLLQTSDRYRGMGLYLQNLLEALSTQNEPGVQWTFITNSQLPDLSEKDAAILSGFRGDVLKAKLLAKKNCELYGQAVKANKATIDSLIVNKGQSTKTVFFIPALFSSEIYPVFPSKGTANLLQFHDIIPFLYPKQYFRDHESSARIDYSQRWAEAYKADLYVTDSETTADDLTIYFGIDPIRTAPIFGAGAHTDKTKPSKPKIDGLNNDFVLMPSGDDFRKNNELAVRAFAELKGSNQLVVTSNFSQETQRQLKGIYPDIIFSGSVSSSELLWLIDNTRLVFFPSEYEGLGLPILEAVNRNTQVACSNIPVFREISTDAFSFFDPKSITSMTTILRSILSDHSKSDQTHFIKRYQEIKAKFTWNNTASLFMGALKRIEQANKRAKLAIFCPSPSSYSAVGKYAFEVHAELSRLYDIDYYYENGQTEFEPSRPNILEYATKYYPVAFFERNKDKYDRVLYHIGNSEFHTQTILSALRYPANAIVHDTWLNGIFDYMERYGYLTKKRRLYESLIDTKLANKKSSCLSSIVTNQKAIFCHSGYSCQSIEEISTNLNINQIFHPIGVPKNTPVRDGITVSFAGIISEDKGISLVANIAELSNIKVKVFGFGVLGESPLLENLATNIEVIKDLTDKEFQDALGGSDILINYRLKYHGETSRSALEAMRWGTVVIVRDIGWFAELPDECVVKVSSEHELIKKVSDLINDPKSRDTIGQAARKFLASEYSFKKYASLISKELKENQ